MLEPTLAYVIAFASFIGVVALQYVLRIRRAFIVRNSRRLGWWCQGWIACCCGGYHWWVRIRTTPLQITVLVLYVGVNMYFVFSSADKRVRQIRAAVAASTNLAPVLFGGRTNLVADSVGISLHYYYFFHHWVARLAILEVAIHAALAGTTTWGAQAVYGLMALIFISLIGLSSLAPLRRFYKLAFAKVHLVLALATLGTLLLHVWLGSPPETNLQGKIPLSLSAFVWTTTFVFRWFRRVSVSAQLAKIHDRATERVRYYREHPDPKPRKTENGQTEKEIKQTENEQSTEKDHAAPMRGTKEYLELAEAAINKLPHDKLEYTGAALLKLDLPRNVRIYPGAYFYLFFREFSLWKRFRGVPMMVYSWEASKARSRSAQSLSFLVQNAPSLSSILESAKAKVWLDGPYGRNLRLEHFNTVVLVAEGMGITGVLPFALSIAQRRGDDVALKNLMAQKQRQTKAQRRGEDATWKDSTKMRDDDGRKFHRDSTKRLTVFWAMEDSSHINWIQEHASIIAGLDPAKVLLYVCIYEPSRRDGEATTKLGIPEKFSSHWKIHHVKRKDLQSVLHRDLGWELQASSESCAIATCGSIDFTQTVRTVSAKHPHATFFELEYQPHSKAKDSAITRPIRKKLLQKNQATIPLYRPEVIRSLSGDTVAPPRDIELGRLRPTRDAASYWENEDVYIWGHIVKPHERAQRILRIQQVDHRRDVSIAGSVSEISTASESTYPEYI